MPRFGCPAPLAVTILLAVGSGGCGLERWFGSEHEERQRRDTAKSVETPARNQERNQEPLTKATDSASVPWYEGSLENALVEAGKQDKLVFVEVGAYWCPPCHRLASETFVVPSVVSALTENYIPLRIDAERSEGPDVVERYHIQAYPTLLVLEPSGVEKGRIVDFVDGPALIVALRRIEQGENVLDELAEAVQNDPDDLEKRYRLGHAYALAAQREQAEEQFSIVMAGDPKGLSGLASKVLYDRAHLFVHKLDGHPERALQAYQDLQRRFPDSPEAIRAFRQIGRVLHELDRDDEAIASLERMVASDPNDVDLKASYGWFCFRQKVAPGSGLKVVDEGLVLDPDNAELHYLRAELLAMLDRRLEAFAAIRAAAAAEPDSMFYDQQVQRFAELQDAKP